MAMKICKECGNEVSSKGVCTKCGKDQRSFFVKHKIISFLLVVFILGAVAGMTGENNSTPTSNQEQEKFTLVSEEKTTDGFGTTYIQGEIKNNTAKTYSYVQVTFNLYDANGAQIGTAMDNINNLESNGTWKYKALGYVTENVASYKFVEITGW